MKKIILKYLKIISWYLAITIFIFLWWLISNRGFIDNSEGKFMFFLIGTPFGIVALIHLLFFRNKKLNAKLILKLLITLIIIVGLLVGFGYYLLSTINRGC